MYMDQCTRVSVIELCLSVELNPVTAELPPEEAQDGQSEGEENDSDATFDDQESDSDEAEEEDDVPEDDEDPAIYPGSSLTVSEHVFAVMLGMLRFRWTIATTNFVLALLRMHSPVGASICRTASALKRRFSRFFQRNDNATATVSLLRRVQHSTCNRHNTVCLWDGKDSGILFALSHRGATSFAHEGSQFCAIAATSTTTRSRRHRN